MKRLLLALCIVTSCAEEQHPIYPDVKVETWNIGRLETHKAFEEFLDVNEMTEYVERQLIDTKKKALYDSIVLYRVPTEWGIAMREAGILPENVTKLWPTFLQKWIDWFINKKNR